MDYTEVAIQVPTLLVEEVGWALQGAGHQGVWVSEIPAEGDRPEKLPVRVYRAGPPEANAEWVAELSAQARALAPHWDQDAWPVEARLVPSEDWADSWKRFWHPMEIGDRLAIAPSWEPYQGDADRIVLALDPEQAFGTGTHPTTQLCLRALEKAVPAAGEGCTVMDVGCGSGILALAAAKLGAGRVLACDTDPVAVTATDTNAQRNGVQDRIVSLEGEVGVLEGQAHVVVANILAEVVAAIAPDLAARALPGGAVLASGIIGARLDMVCEAFQAAGLVVEGTEAQGDWRLVAARRPA